MVTKYQIILSLKCSKIGCVYVVCWMCEAGSHPVTVSEVVYGRQERWSLYKASLTVTGCETTTHSQQTTLTQPILVYSSDTLTHIHT